MRSEQVSAVKDAIFNGRDGTRLSKQILAFLIESSKELRQDVCLSLVTDREGYTADEIHDAALGVGDMCGSRGTTRLNQVLEKVGSEIRVSVHYGDFDPTRTGNVFDNDGQFAGFNPAQVSRPGLVREGMPLRYTFWVSKDYYSYLATLVVATRETLENIIPEEPDHSSPPVLA